MRGATPRQCFVEAAEAVTPHQHVDRLARRVFVMLVGEESQIVEIVIAEVMVEGHGAAVKQTHMFVHPTLLDARRALAPDAQQRHRIAVAVLDPAVEENVAALEIDAGDFGRQLRQAAADLIDQFGRQESRRRRDA